MYTFSSIFKFFEEADFMVELSYLPFSSPFFLFQEQLLFAV